MTALVVQDHAHVWIELAHDRPPGGQGGRPTVGEDHGRSVLGATHLDVQECAVGRAYLEFAGLAHVLLRHRGYLLLGMTCLVGTVLQLSISTWGTAKGGVPAPWIGCPPHRLGASSRPLAWCPSDVRTRTSRTPPS